MSHCHVVTTSAPGAPGCCNLQSRFQIWIVDDDGDWADKADNAADTWWFQKRESLNLPLGASSPLLGVALSHGQSCCFVIFVLQHTRHNKLQLIRLSHIATDSTKGHAASSTFSHAVHELPATGRADLSSEANMCRGDTQPTVSCCKLRRTSTTNDTFAKMLEYVASAKVHN